mgnify:CR=1 FL=1
MRPAVCATAASLFPFVGTIVYLIVRPPEYLDDVRERERILEIFEALTGLRMNMAYVRIGGLVMDLPSDGVARIDLTVTFDEKTVLGKAQVRVTL